MEHNLTHMPIVHTKDGRVYASSRDVALFFDKQHTDVLRAIDNLLKSNNMQKCAGWFVEVVEPRAMDNPGRATRHYDMTKNGFTILVMGFTGEKAAGFKIAYIERFDAMEDTLRNMPIPDLTDPQYLRGIVLQISTLFEETKAQLADANQKIAAEAPKVNVYEALCGSEAEVGLREAAKTLGIGEREFIRRLAAARFIYKSGCGVWYPYAPYTKSGSGIMTLCRTPFKRPGKHGEMVTDYTFSTKITNKGLIYFARKLGMDRTN